MKRAIIVISVIASTAGCSAPSRELYTPTDAADSLVSADVVGGDATPDHDVTDVGMLDILSFADADATDGPTSVDVGFDAEVGVDTPSADVIDADVVIDAGPDCGPVSCVDPVAITAGLEHVCALVADGTVRCWGDNTFGQLGVASPPNLNVPTAVPGISNAVSVSAGGRHTCAVTRGGDTYCWGDNTYQQLGTSGTPMSSTPLLVTGVVARTVSGGSHSTCATLSSGGASCWGEDRYGQLGDGLTASRSTPAAVSGSTSMWTMISTSAFESSSFGIVNGVLYVWGEDLLGQQLGLVPTPATTCAGAPCVTAPTVLNLGAQAVSVAGGGIFACGVTTTGTVLCWGQNNYAQLGDTTMSPHNGPLPIAGAVSGATLVAAGIRHACARTNGGSLFCWGDNSAGQIGFGASVQPTPVQVTGIANVTAVTATNDCTCAIANRVINCWGANGYGQLGDSTNTPHAAPAPVSW